MYCNMTNEEMAFTLDFNMPVRVTVHVNVTSYICLTVYVDSSILTYREQNDEQRVMPNALINEYMLIIVNNH